MSLCTSIAPAVGQPGGGRTSVTAAASGSRRVYASIRSTEVTAGSGGGGGARDHGVEPRRGAVRATVVVGCRHGRTRRRGRRWQHTQVLPLGGLACTPLEQTREVHCVDEREPDEAGCQRGAGGREGENGGGQEDAREEVEAKAKPP